MTHTPGPWFATEPILSPTQHNIFEVEFEQGDGSWEVIATMGGNMTDDENDANARLIAEAPAMLEALRELVELLDGEVVGPNEYANNARAIIDRIERS